MSYEEQAGRLAAEVTHATRDEALALVADHPELMTLICEAATRLASDAFYPKMRAAISFTEGVENFQWELDNPED